MPTIDDYAPLAPFTLDELVSACNAILREKPSMAVQGRTVRYYISTGLLPPPSGAPKYARYGVEHLKRVVAIRRWLDAGLTLEQASERIQRGEHGGETQTIQRKPAPADASRLFFREDRLEPWPSVHRIPLSEHSTLEIPMNQDVREELEQALVTIRRLLKSL
ncbi:MAG: helix-turn-helix domain-containing protein [Fimbriimonas sp.]|nr:helix-turn-helix domain-containing protein [Fimbriimonas sp.]